MLNEAEKYTPFFVDKIVSEQQRQVDESKGFTFIPWHLFGCDSLNSEFLDSTPHVHCSGQLLVVRFTSS